MLRDCANRTTYKMEKYGLKAPPGQLDRGDH